MTWKTTVQHDQARQQEIDELVEILADLGDGIDETIADLEKGIISPEQGAECIETNRVWMLIAQDEIQALQSGKKGLLYVEHDMTTVEKLGGFGGG